ncbi:SUKH-4 family immunity protein [Streptomyces chattanoogensis]|uniref:SUKH-4 family immunity protein n=1 Tax=Streptomyces chattanoogensis TaxID=66876 RepID=UPI00368AED17
MTVSLASATEQLDDWLAEPEPRRQDRVLVVRGPVGAGAGPVLDHVRRLVPDAVYVDCRHLTAEEVTARVLVGLGVSPDDVSARGRDLRDLQNLYRRDAVVVLAHVPWAGPTVTSTEPRRILHSVADRIAGNDRRRIRFVVEGDAEVVRVPRPCRRRELLIDDHGDAEPRTERAEPAPRHPALRALAAAEVHQLPYATWEFLGEAMGRRVEEAALRRLVAEHPDLLSVHADADGTECVGFVSASVRSLVRSADGASAEDQRRIVRHLSAHLHRPAVARYAARALPLHAALGGVLEELLDDGERLARVERYGLLQGMAAAWPRGVPQGGLAADIHYLETQRVDPVSPGEWHSWLHWAAVNRGRHDIADGLVRAGGDGMPWRTLWSRWRPYGVFGPVEGEVGPVDRVLIQRRGGVPVAVVRKEVAYDSNGEEREDWLNEVPYSERVFALADGTEIGAEARATIPIGEDDPGFPEFDEDASLPAPRTPVLAAPSLYGPSAAAGPGRWVIFGSGGLYAVETRPSATPETGTWGGGPFLGAVTAAGVWQCPEEARTDGAPFRAWLESLFGEGSCRPVAAEALPDGLSDPTARDFLTAVGLPFLPDRIRFLTTVDLDREGPVETPWPSDAPSPELEPTEASDYLPTDVEGPFYRLGFLLVDGGIYLDGAGGAVLQDTNSGYCTVQMAGSLPRFVTLLGLYRAYFASPFPTRDETYDARRSLRAWAEEIDPVTEDGDHWEHIFDGSLDDPDSY